MITTHVSESRAFVDIIGTLSSVVASVSTVTCVVVCGHGVNAFARIQTLELTFERWRRESARVKTVLTVAAVEAHCAVAGVVS
jgi:hypothetical protein